MDFGEIWKIVSSRTVVHRHKALSIYNLLQSVLDQRVEGDVAECGVYLGGISALMAAVLRDRKSPKKVYLFDSFKGLPLLDRWNDLPYYKQGALQADRVLAESFVKGCGVSSNIVVRPGWFEDILFSIDRNQRFCVLHIDCDLYASAKTCLEHLYTRLVPGGVMVFDDYFDIGGGVKKAVDEYLLRFKSPDMLFAGPVEQVFLIKGRIRNESDDRFILDSFGDGSTFVSLEFLASNRDYLDDLRGNSLMSELPGGGMRAAATLARQTLRVVDYHDRVLTRFNLGG